MIEYAPFIDDDVNNNSTMLETAVLGLVWKLPSAGVQGEMITDTAAIVFNCTAAVGSVYWSSTSLTLSPEPGSGINVKSWQPSIGRRTTYYSQIDVDVDFIIIYSH